MINSLITRGYQYIDRKNLRGVCYHLIDLNDNLIGMLHICEVQGIIEFNKVSDECTKEDFEGVYTFEKITKNEFEKLLDMSAIVETQWEFRMKE
ncbi:hypothetical protein ACV3Y3_08600 [Clostridium perfringens]